MNNVKPEMAAVVQSFAGRGVSMMMLPKQMKPVWRKKKNNREKKISLSLLFYMESEVPHQLQSLFKNTGVWVLWVWF